jgi:hypothetical protein
MFNFICERSCWSLSQLYYRIGPGDEVDADVAAVVDVAVAADFALGYL